MNDCTAIPTGNLFHFPRCFQTASVLFSLTTKYPRKTISLGHGAGVEAGLEKSLLLVGRMTRVRVRSLMAISLAPSKSALNWPVAASRERPDAGPSVGMRKARASAM